MVEQVFRPALNNTEFHGPLGPEVRSTPTVKPLQLATERAIGRFGKLKQEPITAILAIMAILNTRAPSFGCGSSTLCRKGFAFDFVGLKPKAIPFT